jgi:hypothetical protein
MRRRPWIRAVACALFAAAGFVSPASAVVTFEAVAPDLYFDGSTISDGGFLLTVNGGFGAVDTAAGFLLATPPSGNPTQFYAGLNDSLLTLRAANGASFSLGGFDAGFLAPLPLEPGVIAGRIVVEALTTLGATVLRSWDLGVSGADGAFSFLTFAGAADFAGFGELASATFSTCIYDGSGCVAPFQNLGQFALDNVQVVAIPEPSTYALFVLGLAALSSPRVRRTIARNGVRA